MERPRRRQGWKNWDAREWVDAGERKGMCERTIQPEETGGRGIIKQLTVLAGWGESLEKDIFYSSSSHSPSETFLVYLKRLVWDGIKKPSIAFSNATFQQAAPLPFHRYKPCHFRQDKLCQTQQQDSHRSVRTCSESLALEHTGTGASSVQQSRSCF